MVDCVKIKCFHYHAAGCSPYSTFNQPSYIQKMFKISLSVLRFAFLFSAHPLTLRFPI